MSLEEQRQAQAVVSGAAEVAAGGVPTAPEPAAEVPFEAMTEEEQMQWALRMSMQHEEEEAAALTTAHPAEPMEQGNPPTGEGGRPSLSHTAMCFRRRGHGRDHRPGDAGGAHQQHHRTVVVGRRQAGRAEQGRQEAEVAVRHRRLCGVLCCDSLTPRYLLCSNALR